MTFRHHLAALAVLCTPLAAPAYSSFGDGECAYSIASNISIGDDRVELSDRAKHTWRLQDHRLFKDGREIALSDSERRDLDAYRAGVEKLVPVVTELALDGAALGVEATVLALNALSGEEHFVDNEALHQRMDRLVAKLRTRMDGRHLYHTDSGGGLGDAAFEKEFEQEIESVASEAARRMAGSVGSLIWQSLFDHKALEARSEKIEKLVEQKVDLRAKAIEKKAKPLCAELRRLDVLEAAIGQFDVIKPGSGDADERVANAD